MSKQTRLRVQKEKGGRRAVFFVICVLILGGGVWQLERQFGLVHLTQDFWASVKKTLSSNTTARGTIYDRNLKQLAVTMERVSVYIRTREIESAMRTVRRLNDVLGVNEQRLLEQLERGVLRLWVARDISQEQEEALKKLQLPGVYMQRDEKRYYPHNNLAAHLIGYVEDGIGLSGVEYFYDRLLASRKSMQQKEQQPISSAQDLLLTVDVKIQAVLADLLAQIFDRRDVLRAAAYVMEPHTGAIIAGAQVPGFDPNSFPQYAPEKRINMFLESVLLPDTFRLLFRDGALLFTMADQTSTRYPWWLVADTGDLGGQLRLWEWLGLSEVPATDFSMAGGAIAATVSGQRRLTEPSRNMGLIPEHTTPLNLLSGLSQMLVAGQRVRPFVVKKIIDIETGKEVEMEFDAGQRPRSDSVPQVQKTDISRLFSSFAEKDAEGDVLLHDTIPVAELQNTSEHRKINDFSFVTIPAGDSVLCMLVVVERVPLLPQAQEKNSRPDIKGLIMERIARISVLQQVAKTVADVVEPEVAQKGNYQAVGERQPMAENGTLKTEVSKAPIPPRIMPNLLDLSLRRSLQLLEGLQLQISIEGSGRVVAQKPAAGTVLENQTQCMIILESPAVQELKTVTRISEQ